MSIFTGRFGSSVQHSQRDAPVRPADEKGSNAALPPELRRALDRARTDRDTSPGPALSDRKVEVAPTDSKLLRIARWSALGTSHDLKARAGQPKSDVSLGFLGTWPMSTGYKAVLRLVDSYHLTLADGGLGRAALLSQLGGAEAQLKDLSATTHRYLAASSGGRKEAIRIFQDQVTHELEALQGLKKQVARSKGALPTQDLKVLMAFARQGISLDDVGEHLGRGTKPEAARQRAGAVLSKEEASLYARLDIPTEMERTRVTDLRDEQRVGPQKSLASGHYNTTFEAHFDTPEGLRKVVLKPIPTQERGVGQRIGIDRDNPRTAMRNLASCDVDRALGFDVLVKTELALVTPPPPPPERKKELMLAMEPAPGQTGHRVDRSLLKQAAVIQKLLQLQLLDQLCAQADRHGGNYRINVESQGRVTVKGYDNDQCMGSKAKTADDVAYGPGESRNFRGVLLPPVVDTDTARALTAMTRSQLRSILKDTLSPDEVEAAESRLTDIKLHLAELEERGRIVPMDELAAHKNFMHFTGRNSYAVRDWLRAGY